MATTKQLAAYVLERDQHLRSWFEEEHGFTLDKIKHGDLEDYRDLIGVIIREGVNNNLISQAQADGQEEL